MFHETTINSTDKIKIYLKHSPSKSDSTILFLHGYPDTHMTWSFQMDRFKDDYQVACIDLRGAGRSSRPKHRSDYNIREMFKDISSAIQYLNPKKERSVHLVGHDWGSMIGWCYASDPIGSGMISSYTGIAGPHPTLAKCQMLSYAKKGIWSWNIEEMGRFFRQGIMSWYFLFFQFPILPELTWTLGCVPFWRNMLGSGGVPKTDPMWDYTPQEILQSSIGPIQLYRELIQGEAIPVPERIDTPCQAIVPVNDFAITPEIYENLSEHATHFRKNFLNANHWVHREQPDQVASLIRNFIKNV